MTVVMKPMSVGYVKEVRRQVDDAIRMAKEQGAHYIPVFWTGNHLKPVLIKLYLRKNSK